MEGLIVAFDVGDKRIGVAVSDPFGEYAVPCDTYFRTGNALTDARALAKFASSRGASLIVCGLPLNADGTESVQTEKTRRFVSALARETEIPVVFEDERYTTREARRDLNAMGVSAKKDKKKKNVDSLAAAYILEGYLAKRKKEKSMKEKENDYEEEEDYIVDLIDEDGNSRPMEHLMTYEYKGEWYCAFTPVLPAKEDDGAEDGEEEVYIYRIVGEENDETLEVIEDDALLDELYDEFLRIEGEAVEDEEEE